MSDDPQAGADRPAAGRTPESAPRSEPESAPRSAAESAREAFEALPKDLTGADLARAMLEAAKAKAPQRRTSGKGVVGRRRGRRGYTSAGPDPRDPQPFAAVLAKLIKDRGWQRPAAEGAVFGAWERVVGGEIAAKCRPTKLEDAELTVEAVSTAWATQLRMLTPKIIAQIAKQVGPNVVTRIRVHGPAAPSWQHGRFRVRGRGPGDTYG